MTHDSLLMLLALALLTTPACKSSPEANPISPTTAAATHTSTDGNTQGGALKARAPGEDSSTAANEKSEADKNSDPNAKPKLRSFAPEETYRGVIRLPAGSQVIRDQKAFDAFVDQIPTHIVSKGPRKHDKSKDPLLARPTIDWNKKMLLLGVCHSLYCRYDFDGFQHGDGAIIVHARRGEPSKYDGYNQRPGRPGGGEAVGHYTALLLPTDKNTYTFRERSLREAPKSAPTEKGEEPENATE